MVRKYRQDSVILYSVLLEFFLFVILMNCSHFIFQNPLGIRIQGFIIHRSLCKNIMLNKILISNKVFFFLIFQCLFYYVKGKLQLQLLAYFTMLMISIIRTKIWGILSVITGKYNLSKMNDELQKLFCLYKGILFFTLILPSWRRQPDVMEYTGYQNIIQ